MSEITQEQHDKIIRRGIEALRAGDFVTAGQIAETAIARDPNDLTGLVLLSKIHNDLRNYGTALTVARMTLQVAQAAGCVSAEHWFNVSGACRKVWKQAEALQALDKAAELSQPDDPDIDIAYSSYWLSYGDFVKAEHHARRAAELYPPSNYHSAAAHMNLGMALLALDRWEEAWPHTEHRKKLSSWTRPSDPFPQWSGQKVGTLIVHGEQGIGDELFFYSLLHRIVERDLADRIVVECTERLVKLLRRSLGCEVYGSLDEAARNGAFDPALLEHRGKPQAAALMELEVGPSRDMPHIVAVGSLPAILGATRENCADSAYLTADPLRAIWWRGFLEHQAQGRPIIGVAWRGGTYENHELLRNPPLELFARLNPARYCLVSVQYSTDEASRALTAATAERLGMLHFQQAIDDIDEQAALIRACDKLVTVAQTAMHIGGAVGTDTLALIGQYPKWDCGQSGDAVPFWKSVKAIRQRDDDWSGVFDRLLVELGEEPPKAAKLERFGPLTGGATMDLSHITIERAAE